MPTANSTPLNLDTITSAQNNQIVNVNAYYQANVIPATPSGGTYNFTTFTLTAPAGWTANIPSTANTSVYISSAAFTGNSSATAAPPATSWTTPALYATNFSANAGAPGQRGFVPMGYVITASDPTAYSNAAFTTAYSSSRTNSSPPIGLGFAPIQYDTAQFAYQNLFTGNTITTVKQYDGAGWTGVVGDVISGGLFVPGSINANILNTNQVYALTVASTNANVGNVTSPGFWLSSTTGDARLAGNTTIGNNLTVGADAQVGANLNVGSSAIVGDNLIVGSNAQIGGNLNVTGLITSSSLQSNTVATTTMVTQAVSTGVGLNTNTTESYPFPNNTTLYTYTVLQPSITTTVNGQAVYVNAQVSFRIGFNSSTLISVNAYLLRNGVALGSVVNFYVINGVAGVFTYLIPSFTYYDVPYTSSTGTATYSIGLRFSGTSGTNVSTLQFQGGTMVLQGMKR
jgi:acetyltransferase-like isoleucine patch superfamily enzyme